MTTPLLPGAGVTTAHGRKNGKFQRGKRARFRAFQSELDRVIRRVAKLRAWPTNPDADFVMAESDRLFIENEAAKLRAIWIPDH